jgi:hypothetical protein
MTCEKSIAVGVGNRAGQEFAKQNQNYRIKNDYINRPSIDWNPEGVVDEL